MANIYDQHRAAFANVSAYVVLLGGERVATVALKFPKAGEGRLYAYVHWVGEPMVRGCAAGYGYDKRSAACASAADRLPLELSGGEYADGTPHSTPEERAAFLRFRQALRQDDGYGWDRRLQDAGFKVILAV
ncbi:hypothetical protein NON00_02235 [Roseomonas sp. GC11]|uniref:hypothetical protein n=1 Tax=Roseomonas sp. GC11 TaxID=2950546 RepID=UPI0021092DD1|nr:hypothetical protein [Roseomonas sp. GC11]MCQ4158745.1 hypothetical protein [Roseomonas sp. GC11]